MAKSSSTLFAMACAGMCLMTAGIPNGLSFLALLASFWSANKYVVRRVRITIVGILPLATLVNILVRSWPTGAGRLPFLSRLRSSMKMSNESAWRTGLLPLLRVDMCLATDVAVNAT